MPAGSSISGPPRLRILFMLTGQYIHSLPRYQSLAKVVVVPNQAPAPTRSPPTPKLSNSTLRTVPSRRQALGRVKR